MFPINLYVCLYVTWSTFLEWWTSKNQNKKGTKVNTSLTSEELPKRLQYDLPWCSRVPHHIPNMLWLLAYACCVHGPTKIGLLRSLVLPVYLSILVITQFRQKEWMWRGLFLRFAQNVYRETWNSPSAMISSMVTWCRPIVNTRPMKLPPPPEPAPPPPTPEPGPELTISRRESKNFFISFEV